MSDRRQREIEYLCEKVEIGNSFLLYGEREFTQNLLKEIYNISKEKEKFLCSWHDSSKIKGHMDFFEPILKLKFGDDYEKMKKEWMKYNPVLKDLFSREDTSGFLKWEHIQHLSRLCAMEEKSPYANRRKLPVLFIDGLEELFFNMEYGYSGREKNDDLLRDIYRDDEYLTRLETLSKRTIGKNGFGNCLRASLHQTGLGVFCGTIKDENSIDFKAIMSNYHYSFYMDNFLNHHVDD